MVWTPNGWTVAVEKLSGATGRTLQPGFINTSTLSVCVSVSWPSMNVTQNYLNKRKSEVIAAGVAATGAVTLALQGLVADRASSCLFSFFSKAASFLYSSHVRPSFRLLLLIPESFA